MLRAATRETIACQFNAVACAAPSRRAEALMPLETLDFAKMARATIHTPGLFLSLDKRVPIQTVDREWITVSGDRRIRFVGPQLGVKEMRILHALVAAAGPQCAAAGRADSCGDRVGINKLSSSQTGSFIVQLSYASLARSAGYFATSGTVRDGIRSAIARMCETRVFEPDQSGQGWRTDGESLLTDVIESEGDRVLKVRLCRTLTKAVRGGRGSYLRFSLEDDRKLRSDAAQLLHNALHFPDPGTSKTLKLSTLVAFVYGANEPSGSKVRKQRMTVRQALMELNVIGWTVVDAPTGYNITRPKFWGSNMTSSGSEVNDGADYDI